MFAEWMRTIIGGALVLAGVAITGWCGWTGGFFMPLILFPVWMIPITLGGAVMDGCLG